MSESLQLNSVTWLIKKGLGAGDQIVGWAAKEAAICSVRSRGTVAEMLKDQDEDEVIKWIASARFRSLKKAALRGTELHTAAEALALGATPIIDALYLPYVERYAEWLQTWKPRFLMAETPVYNVGERYAGTLDGIFELAGSTVLFDLKTTPYGPHEERSRPPYAEVALQLAAYARASEVGVISERRFVPGTRERLYIYDPGAKHEPMPKVDTAVVIVVSPYDCFATETRIDEHVWQTFLHVRECAKWRHAGELDLFGPPLAAARTDLARAVPVA